QKHGDHHGRARAHNREFCHPHVVAPLPLWVDREDRVAGDPQLASETRLSTSVLSVDHCSGFSRNASAPATRLCSRAPPSTWPVITRIFVGRVAGSSFTLRQTWKPSRPGMKMSRIRR